MKALLNNLYRAFDRREETLVYDRLAQSVSGDLLTQVFLEMRRGMELENQGGARVKVQDVAVTTSKISPLDEGTGFTADCVWTVSGSVGHWGHLHQRVNQYQADIRVEPVDDQWKITSVSIRNQARIDPTVR